MVEDVSIDSNKAASLAIVDDDEDMILNCILKVGLQETDFGRYLFFSLKRKERLEQTSFPASTRENC